MQENTNENIDPTVYSKNVIEFVTVANEYCSFVENISGYTKKDFIESANKLLSLVYLKAMMLPGTEVTDESPEKFVTEFDWQFVDTNITDKLVSDNVFIEFSRPMNPHESESMNLSECFADIYQDLKDFTMLYQVGTQDAIKAGIYECKFNFEQIWGQQILLILTEFHNLLFGNSDLADEKPAKNTDKNSGENWVKDLFED